jgi:UDP-GlcNAc:undecaprenyl-phosphate GlcNAc-1-phosphate transferase
MNPMWIAFGLALLASLALTPLARGVALRLRAVDLPDGLRKLQKQPVPLLGGVAVYVALVLSLGAVALTGSGGASGLRELSLVLAVAAGFVCLLGCVDDCRDLNARFKLLLQTASVLPVVIGGYSVDRVMLFGYPIDLGWLGVPLTVFWMLGCINALNLLDGMDGLASTVGLSTAAMMAIISSSMGNHHVALIAVALAGALTGFLVYNLPPASIYLGDSGSMVIGLVVGILSIQGSLKTTATLSLTAPAVIMSIPILDTLLAIIRRKLTGRSIASADRGHIHHRLLDRGLTTWQALCVIGALCLTTGAAATASILLSSDGLAWIVTVSLVVVLIRIRAFGHHELSLVKLTAASLLTRLVNRLVRTVPQARHQRAIVAGRGFDDLWSDLTADAALWNAWRLEVSVEHQGTQTGYRLWSKPAPPRCNGFDWSLELQFGSAADSLCRMRVAGNDPQSQDPWYLLPLVQMLKRFGEHWVENPRDVPLVLPLADIGSRRQLGGSIELAPDRNQQPPDDISRRDAA